MTAEHRRLAAAETGNIPWKMWGPYLSERQWGTVREDYSEGASSPAEEFLEFGTIAMRKEVA